MAIIEGILGAIAGGLQQAGIEKSEAEKQKRQDELLRLQQLYQLQRDQRKIRENIAVKSWENDQALKLKQKEMEMQQHSPDYLAKVEANKAQADYYRAKAQAEASPKSTKPEIQQAADGTLYTIDPYSGQAKPIMTNLSPEQVAQNQAAANAQLDQTLNSKGLLQQAMQKSMNVSYNPNTRQPQVINSKVWENVQAPDVPTQTPLKVAPNNGKMQTFKRRDGAVVDAQGNIIVPPEPSIVDLQKAAEALMNQYTDMAGNFDPNKAPPSVRQQLQELNQLIAKKAGIQAQPQTPKPRPNTALPPPM